MNFTDVAPRLSASYDLLGNGRTIVSGSYGMYFAQGVGLASGQISTDQANYTLPWSDLNHDGAIQANELGATGTTITPLNPATGLTVHSSTVDPHLQNGRAREWTARIDRDLWSTWSVGAAYIGRIYDRERQYCCGVPSTAYVARTWTDPTTGLSSTYYVTDQQAFPIGLTSVLENIPGRSADYRGIELAIRKRLAHRWSFDPSFTRQASIAHWPAGSYSNPTGIDKIDGRPDDANMPRFIVRAHGSVGLPWDVRAAASLNVQEGAIRTLVIDGPGSTGQLAPAVLSIHPFGTDRYPTLRMLDAQVDKTMTFGPGHTRIIVSAVVFNVFNASTPLSLINNVSRATFNNILDMVGPRVVRIGASIMF